MARRATVRLFALLMLLPMAGHADFDTEAYPRYETCALCHGLFGVSHNAKFPHLGGQNPVYLEAQLRAFIAGTRHNDGGQMAAIVTELQPGDLELVVEWFSTQDPPEPAALPEGNTGAATFAALDCASCHGAAAPEEGVPHLTAQHSGYLLKQMADFRDGRRDAPEIAAMHQDLLQISDAALLDIADYLAATAR